MENKTDCHQIGYVEDDFGNVIARDLIFPRDDELFAVTVGTKKYYDDVITGNAGIHPGLRADENILVFDDVNSLPTICEKLTTELPFDQLQPFVETVIFDEDPTSV